MKVYVLTDEGASTLADMLDEAVAEEAQARMSKESGDE